MVRKEKIEKIVLSGGGTGGHIYPALAIYNQLKEENPDLKCLYIGTREGLEAKIVQDVPGIRFVSIEISGLKRSLSLSNLKVVWQMLTATSKAKRIIERFNPDVVVGTGGFVCAPVLNAAAKLKYPTLIHEQNSVAGVTNKFLAGKVTRIATSFKEVHKDFVKNANKLTYTGNPRGQEVHNYPVVPNILSQQFGLKDKVPTVLIFGGSRGAPAINQAAVNSIDNFAGKEYQVIIGTGRVHYDEWTDYIREKEITVPENVKIVNYIEDMPALMKQLSLVVSRSGATTISELTTLGLPSILIPSPYVTANHQEHNAKSLVNQNAAQMILEEKLTSGKLTDLIDNLMADPEGLEQISANALKFGTPEATDDIIKILKEII